MDLIEAIKERKSIRGYKPQPVSKEVLKKILEVAIRAPSAMNTQPWEFTILTGDTLTNVKKANLERYDSGGPKPESITKPYTGAYRERQVKLAVQLFGLMEIAREDKEKRARWIRRGASFFDAPAVIVVSYERSLGEAALFDLGTITQTICLVALTYGLGTCIQEGVVYPEVIRELTGLPESKRVVITLTIGYPDWDFPANKVASEREPVDTVTAWH